MVGSLNGGGGGVKDEEMRKPLSAGLDDAVGSELS